MKPDIENLKVWISGRSTTGYQRALGMREFEKLLDYVAELEQLRQPPVISCVCPNEIKTGTVSIHCCNLCGKPDEDWWGKH
jgi:hypothetical protein